MCLVCISIVESMNTSPNRNYTENSIEKMFPSVTQKIGVVRSLLVKASVSHQEGWGSTTNFALVGNCDLNFNPTDDSQFYG